MSQKELHSSLAARDSLFKLMFLKNPKGSILVAVGKTYGKRNEW